MLDLYCHCNEDGLILFRSAESRQRQKLERVAECRAGSGVVEDAPRGDAARPAFFKPAAERGERGSRHRPSSTCAASRAAGNRRGRSSRRVRRQPRPSRDRRRRGRRGARRASHPCPARTSSRGAAPRRWAHRCGFANRERRGQRGISSKATLGGSCTSRTPSFSPARSPPTQTDQAANGNRQGAPHA